MTVAFTRKQRCLDSAVQRHGVVLQAERAGESPPPPHSATPSARNAIAQMEANRRVIGSGGAADVVAVDQRLGAVEPGNSASDEQVRIAENLAEASISRSSDSAYFGSGA
jgi:hypothetical protein